MASDWCPNGWQNVKLVDLGEVNRGRSRHRPRYAEHLYGGPHPFIQTGDVKQSGGRITTYHQTYSEAGLAQSRLWPTGTMCITIAANIAETAILTFPACFPDSIIGFIADERKCNVYYVEYMFRYLKQRIQNEATGSVQDNINLATLDRLRFPLPPLPEQRAIAHILGSLDDKIELNCRMNQTLEAIARAIFKSWFVDFDPVRAKAKGRPTGLPDDIAALFPDSFEDSELGEIPKGWDVGVVSDLGNVICGKTPPTKDPENYGEHIPFITIPDMHGKVFVTQTGKYLSAKGANTQLNKYLPAQSICVSCIATPGLVVMTTEQSQTNQQINSVIPKDEESSYYCYQVLNRLGDQIRAGGSGGSVLLNLNKTLFPNIKILIPDHKIIEGYQKIVEPFFEKLLQNQRESASLFSLRDTLLPKLITGELRVPDAEKFVEEAGL